MRLPISAEYLTFSPELCQAKDVLSVEYFEQHYAERLARQRIPLIYLRQFYGTIGDTGLHQHVDHYALYVVHGGRGVHEINGHPYGIARGDIYLTPPGSEVAYRDSENLSADAFCFQISLFQEDEIAALRSLPGFRGLFVESADWNAHRLHLAPQERGEVETRLQEIVAELQQCEAGKAEAQVLARILFFRLLVGLARQWKENVTAPKIAAHRNIELAEVLRFCEAHFADDIGVPQLAAKMFLSPGRFTEIFKQEMGVPPGEYLRNLRLSHAQTLLRTTANSATDIAYTCGFSDATQFSRAFKKAFEVPPSEYRKRFG